MSTDSKTAEIRRLRDGGMSWRQIAKAVGLSQTVCKTRYMHGLKRPAFRVWTEAENQALLASKPEDTAKIAAQLGRTVRACHQQRHALLKNSEACFEGGYFAEKAEELRADRQEFRARVLELRRKGLCVLDIARQLNALGMHDFARVARICNEPENRRYGKGDVIEGGGVVMRRPSIKGEAAA